jgi:hypothetical protein
MTKLATLVQIEIVASSIDKVQSSDINLNNLPDTQFAVIFI